MMLKKNFLFSLFFLLWIVSENVFSQDSFAFECRERCNAKLCKEVNNKIQCLENCSIGDKKNLKEVQACFKTLAPVKNITDANNAASYRSRKLMKELFNQYPKAQYFLDEKTISSQASNQRPSGEEIAAVENAIRIILNDRKTFVDRFSSMNNIKTSVHEAQVSLRQIKMLYKQMFQAHKVYRDHAVTRISLKIYLAEKFLLPYKNLCNQGEALKFKLTHDTDFKNPHKKLCMKECSAEKCGKDHSVYGWCIKNCRREEINSCLTAAMQERAGQITTHKRFRQDEKSQKNLKPQIKSNP